MQRVSVKIILLVLFAVILGFSIHFANPAAVLIILFLWFVAAVSSLVAITIGLFSKKFHFLYLIGFLPFLVGFGFETAIRKFKHNEAVKLNVQLEHYRMEHGSYPKNIIDLNLTITLTGLKYTPNKDFTNYRIEYLMDEFNREYFETESKSWGTLGWND